MEKAIEDFISQEEEAMMQTLEEAKLNLVYQIERINSD